MKNSIKNDEKEYWFVGVTGYPTTPLVSGERKSQRVSQINYGDELGIYFAVPTENEAYDIFLKAYSSLSDSGVFSTVFENDFGRGAVFFSANSFVIHPPQKRSYTGKVPPYPLAVLPFFPTYTPMFSLAKESKISVLTEGNEHVFLWGTIGIEEFYYTNDELVKKLQEKEKIVKNAIRAFEALSGDNPPITVTDIVSVDLLEAFVPELKAAKKSIAENDILREKVLLDVKEKVGKYPTMPTHINLQKGSVFTISIVDRTSLL